MALRAVLGYAPALRALSGGRGDAAGQPATPVTLLPAEHRISLAAMDGLSPDAGPKIAAGTSQRVERKRERNPLTNAIVDGTKACEGIKVCGRWSDDSQKIPKLPSRRRPKASEE